MPVRTNVAETTRARVSAGCGDEWKPLGLVNEVKDFRLDGVFDVVICNEDVKARKPDPEGLFRAVEQLACPTSNCSYVGDVPEDIQAGKRAQMHTVGVKARSRLPANLRRAHRT